MARIGPALDVIAAATTPDERARPRGGGARTVPARGATAGRDRPCLRGHLLY